MGDICTLKESVARRLASYGLLLALTAVLLHVRGFGFDEIRRPFVVFGSALVLLGGIGLRSEPCQLLRIADVGLLAVVVSASFCTHRTAAAASLFPAATAWIILRAVVLEWIPRSRIEYSGACVFALLGVAFSGYGLLQYVGMDVLRLGPTLQPVSTIGNTNYAGIFSAILTVTNLSLALFSHGIRQYLGFTAALAGGLHVASSGSVAGMLGLGAGLACIVVILILRGNKVHALWAMFVFALAVIPASGRLSQRLSDIMLGEDRTAKVRLGLWSGTAKLIEAYPLLGCGPGNYEIAFPPFRDPEERKTSQQDRGLYYVISEDPHNSYLMILAESGPIALMAVIGILFTALLQGVKRSLSTEVCIAQLSLAGTAGVVVAAVSGMFNSLSGHLPFAVVLSLLAGVTGLKSANQTECNGGRLIGMTTVACMLALATTPFLVADIHYYCATQSMEPYTRHHHALKAVTALPGHWQARLQLAAAKRAIGEDFAVVRAELREVLRVNPYCVLALVELSCMVTANEEEDLLLRAEMIAPEFVLVQIRLATVDLRKRHFESIRTRMGKILELIPDNIEAVYMTGKAWLLQGMRKEALPWLQRAARKNPKIRERLADEHPELRGDVRFVALLGP